MIFVAKTFLPPQEEYQQILATAWNKNWITNRGTLVKKLEATLQEYLRVDHLLAMTNGTLPLQIAIKAMDLQGEIITTPFSYVATTSSIVWEGATPVFVDIDPNHWTLNENGIEAAITEKTTAILATHVFGNPCHVEKINQIAKKHHLKVIYDAAHCFGVSYKGRSIFGYGDISTCSFHATKIFHTGEGGALICNDSDLIDKVFYHHNFGHKGKEDFQGLGINAKMSELQAAMGLAVLPYLPENIAKREKASRFYRSELKGVTYMELREGTHYNFSYFPVLFRDETQLKQVVKSLNDANIYPRRYFYPSLDTLPYVKKETLPIASDISNRILCLPLYEDLSEASIASICQIINDRT